MFKKNDRVQFSKHGMRGLKGVVLAVGLGGKVLVQWDGVRWDGGGTQWMRTAELVRENDGR